jgi:pimeloyl-ACP methyl ester carboxylesterase
MGKPRAQASVNRAAKAILAGLQKYTTITVPALAIFCPRDADDAAQAKAFEEGVPSARVVRLPNANRMVFLSNEADVLREMKAFLAGLP